MQYVYLYIGLAFKKETSEFSHKEHNIFMVLRLGHFRKQITISLQVLKRGVAEGWRRSE
jgi:hypothetical protein